MRNDINGMSDILETVSVLRTAKNLFFFLSMAALVVLGTIFVFSRTGMIEYPWVSADVCGDKSQPAAVEPAEPQADVVVPALAATISETPAEEAKPEVIEDKPAEVAIDTNQDQQQEIAEPVTEQSPDTEKAEVKTAKWKLSWKDASSLIRLCNAVIVLLLTMYCFTLLICLKITLVARLGGAYYITSAMFLSLFAAVLFMPWQAAFPGVGLAGAMYVPYEFACATMNYENLSKFDAVMFYARYAGLSVIVIFSLIMAQGRSMCWAAKCDANEKD